jgi:hypothetical protein
MNRRQFDKQFFRNFVAKNSRDKSGAGPHKSNKDYDRHEKEYENDAMSYVELTEQIGILRLERDAAGSEHARLQEEINNLLDQLKEI